MLDLIRSDFNLELPRYSDYRIAIPNLKQLTSVTKINNFESTEFADFLNVFLD
jgi:hypothetical protein